MKSNFNVSVRLLNWLDEPSAWNIFFDYFIVKFHPSESLAGYLHVIYLQRDMAVLKIKDTKDESCKLCFFKYGG